MTKPFFSPRHIVWSTDLLDLDDPFQRKWFTEQVLLHGRADDLRYVNFTEVAEWLDDFNLLSEIYNLWSAFLERKNLMSPQPSPAGLNERAKFSRSRKLAQTTR